MTTFTASELDSPKIDHRDPYLDWAPAAHAEGCSEKGWQVRIYEPDVDHDGPRPVGMRAYCTSCEVQYELAARTHFRDEHGDAYGPSVIREGRAYHGHQTKPRRVMGFWLHAHGRHTGWFDPDTDAYHDYHLTASATPPASPDEVLGTVAVMPSPRARRSKFQARLAQVEQVGRKKWLRMHEAAPKLFGSPLGAARWIARHLAETDSSSS